MTDRQTVCKAQVWLGDEGASLDCDQPAGHAGPHEETAEQRVGFFEDQLLRITWEEVSRD